MYKATKNTTYLDIAKDLYNSKSMDNPNLWFSWDDKKPGIQVLMANITGDSKYNAALTNYGNKLDNARTNKHYSGENAVYTPKGLLWVFHWGSARYAANNAHLCAQVTKSPLEIVRSV